MAGRCVECEAVVFPLRQRCPACGGEVERIAAAAARHALDVDDAGLRAEAAVRRRRGEFVPYGVGYVEFAGFLRVEGRLTEADPERLRIGMPMEVVAVRRAGAATYAFAPVDEP